MASEIERKFLVDTAQWKPAGEGTLYRQGYLSTHPERTVRVRIEGDQARLTLKGQTRGISRTEIELEMPLADAQLALAELCEQPIIEKRRHKEVHGGKEWEIDVFLGDNAGLVLAEVELASEEEAVQVPPWATEEVSHDPRYYNSYLVARPYRTWMPVSGAV
jgi:adenylate cyclase